MSSQSVPYIIHTQDDLTEFLVLRDQLIIAGRQDNLPEATIEQQTAHLAPFQQILPEYKSTVPAQPQQGQAQGVNQQGLGLFGANRGPNGQSRFQHGQTTRFG